MQETNKEGCPNALGGGCWRYQKPNIWRMVRVIGDFLRLVGKLSSVKVQMVKNVSTIHLMLVFCVKNVRAPDVGPMNNCANISILFQLTSWFEYHLTYGDHLLVISEYFMSTFYKWIFLAGLFCWDVPRLFDQGLQISHRKCLPVAFHCQCLKDLWVNVAVASASCFNILRCSSVDVICAWV